MSVREDAMLSDSVKTIVFSALRIARGMDNEADRYFLQINQTKQMASRWQNYKGKSTLVALSCGQS